MRFMLTIAEWEAIRLTMFVSAVAVLFTFPIAIGIGWMVAKYRFPGKSILEVLINLPLVLPPVATGYLLLVAMGRHGLIGRFLESILGIRMVFDWKGAALASAVVGFPLMVRPIRLAFEQVDDRLLHAARTLGATRLDAFWSIALPLARPGILAGSVLAFARSVGEFGATIMIAGNIPGETQTISLLIYSAMDAPGGARMSMRLVIVAIAIAAVALIASERILRRQRERQGRGAL
jgi:molybdate transport system permease protein